MSAPSSHKPRRIDQILSSYGYSSRSEARAWVRAGRVTLDGQPVKSAEDKAPVDRLRIDGEPIEFPDGVLVLYYKPPGCVCTHDSREGPTIYDALPPRWPRRNPPVTSVGRLDRDTTGVLLLTDQGPLVQRWTSPRHKVPKVYEVTIDGVMSPDWIPLFAAGTLQLEGESAPCLPARLEIHGPHTGTLELVEGRYHQVKRMFASQGSTVTRLHRSRFGEHDLAGLKPGEWRALPLPASPA
jgi:16S rRNA pseudouridine516 synthase